MTPAPPPCPRCGGIPPASAGFCPTCGTPLAGADGDAPAEARKTVTVLFCDLQSSTALAGRLDPEALRSVLLGYFAAVRACLERHGGTVEKFIGDAVVGVFGVPVVHEDDALRAVRAALDVLAARDDLNAELRRELGEEIEVRVGINTGEAVVTRDAFAEQALVAGEVMNVAARLQQAAGAGGVLLGPDTHRLVPAAEVEPLGPLPVRGKTQPVEAYRLVGLHPEPAPTPVRRFETPLIGRERELTQLTLEWERAVRDSACHLVTVLGDAGVGKSRLAGEFLAMVQEGLARPPDDGTGTVSVGVGLGVCRPYGSGGSLRPLGDAVRQLLEDLDLVERAGQDDDLAEAWDRLRGSLLQDDTPGASLDELYWALGLLLGALAAQGGIVLVLDDLQWAPGALLEVLDELLERLADFPVMVLCVARTDLLDARPTWASGAPNATWLTLPPLSADESRHLVSVLAETVPHDPAAMDQLVARAGGNPLFLEQLLAMLTDGGDEDDLPLTVQALIAARLDQLEPAERRLLERAATVGQEFGLRPLAVLTEGRAADPALRDRTLRALVRRRLVQSGWTENRREPTYRFANTLIQQVAYRGVPKRRRAQWHQELATWLRSSGAPDDAVGRHLQQAYELLREVRAPAERTEDLRRGAGRHLGAAGVLALRRGDLGRARGLLEESAALARPGDDSRLASAEALAEVRLLQGDPGALAELERLAGLAGASGEPQVAGHARLQLAALLPDGNPLQTLEETVRAVLPAFLQAGDEFGLARAWLRLGQVSQARGRFADADADLRRALASSIASNAQLELATVLGAVALSAWMGPEPAPAAIDVCRGLLADHGAGRMAVRIAVNCPLAVMLGSRRELAAADELLAAASRIAGTLGHAYAQASVPVFEAEMDAYRGDWPRAAARLRHARAACDRLGDVQMTASATVALARALLETGDHGTALEWAGSLGVDLGPVLEAGRRGVQARVLAERGDRDAALRHARAAIDAAATTDSTACAATARLDLAHTLAALGDPAGRDEAADAAATLFEAKGHLVGRDWARQLRGGREER